ncbi:glycosyltransferase [Pyrus ussuriensis x Pyrus communis]|uniref:Glycosyltransferase n=1 Tax=Pyrus ussuriensis x Pyrus communis TaxID=2448454 RepID=A0A5N5I615_9ROSA|nr:glycosyltransferase [Pyrus ussuriensis x Pyrus communis]KAB2634573.1 glycosyltransferase [Pyrus ussuriensis x Pyrus communis]
MGDVIVLYAVAGMGHIISMVELDKLIHHYGPHNFFDIPKYDVVWNSSQIGHPTNHQVPIIDPNLRCHRHG